MACKPVLNGVLWNLGNSLFPTQTFNYTESAEDWRADFDAMHQIGLDTLMLFTGVPIGMTTPAAAAPYLIEIIASECDRRNMNLIIATGGHPYWWDELKMPDEMTLINGFIDQIYERYGHHRSFAGWYIDYEFSLRYGELGDMLRELYRETVISCKAKTPDLPVVASPFFNPPTETNIMNCGHHEPQEYYEYWRDLIAFCHFDVLALQDNGGQHLSFFEECVTEPYIAAFAKACAENGCRFWGNVETGEFLIGSAREFTEKYGNDGNVNKIDDGWRPVPIERLKRKLRTMSKYSEMNISWGYQYYYRSCLSEVGKAAYENYKAFLQEEYPDMIIK
ncbi:MAG: DUF4434 domain-containing protein [Victivallales bacterium]|nr:DUF4434 domain-containing protein [Victivallales bacterium]